MVAAFPLVLHAKAEEHLRRLNSRLRGSGRTIDLHLRVRQDANNNYLDFQAEKERATLIIPRARQNEYGNLVIGDRNDRALCPFMIVLNGQPRHVSYQQLILLLLSENLEELFPTQGKRNFFDKILWGFAQGRGRLTVGFCQRFLNLQLFNALPLSGTPMQDWAMNQRLMILDPVFDKLRPEEKLEYHRQKNEWLFPWGSIGLSDGAAATKNYILQTDLRKYTAFGQRHHNPIRNLYSTLGMKGEETAYVISEPAEELEKQGVVRKGWNWMTVFLDLPDNFEDQILVDKRHADKEVSYVRSFNIFGQETVQEGDSLIKGRVLGVNLDESPVVFNIDCDRARVIEIKDSVVPFDGQDQAVRIITLEVVYSFKEGFKITNQHGNKGIIRLAELGTVWIGGGSHPIDVIVSAKSVQKRKNFGQVLEALTNNLHAGRTVVPNDYEVTEEQVCKSLQKAGLPESGKFLVRTPWGEFNTLAGVVHWGVTKIPEEQLWEGGDVWIINQKGLRTKGNKVSTIELKALTTLLGPQSKAVAEILQHQQGVGEVRELLQIIQGLQGHRNDFLPTIDPERLIYLPAGLGTFHTFEGLMGTVADEDMYPQGGYIRLPFPVEVRLSNDFSLREDRIQEGIAKEVDDDPNVRVFQTDLLPIPSWELRQPWQHPTGKLGLSDIATSINQILEALDRLKHKEIRPEAVSTLVFRYFHFVSRSLSLKTGKLSQYLMSVRYPWSSKATASLGTGLEENWIEIHRDMARDLKVSTGDYVLVERFPCLGFMSTRIQRVQVTTDPECKYVIRVSGNSLVSMNLDFDGDVIYVMSFHTEGAKAELKKNFHNPHPQVGAVLREMNARKVPITQESSLSDLGLRSFTPMGPEEHADNAALSLAVKVWTGPVIALCYSLMRIVEGNIPYSDREGHINVEVFLDRVGNSVFSQKHGIKSLREECIEAVCLADAKALIRLGFPERETHQLCQIIRGYAAKLRVVGDEGLRAHYQAHLEKGRSHIINAIVRRFHKSYFATRANLHPIELLEHLDSKPRDLVGHLIKRSLGE